MTMLKDTIISAFNYDGTLLKWLKKVEDALQNASASEFRVNKKGNATISFSIVFANGDTLESGDIILQQGESVTGATIRQGHLILTLSNGDELDAGDLGAVTSFSINASQHLIVTYQNGTTQDLGAIFTGNVNINGNFTANSIIENMNGYSCTVIDITPITQEVIFAGAVKNGNKLTLTYAVNLTKTGAQVNNVMCIFNMPNEVKEKLHPTLIGTYRALTYQNFNAVSEANAFISLPILIELTTSNVFRIDILNTNAMTENVKYYLRIEVTYLLSESLVN